METLFDLDTGRANRDAGVGLVEEYKATDVQRVRRWIDFFTATGRRFTADDVRANLSVAVAPAAFGSAFSGAVKSGQIVEVGRTMSRCATNNARKVTVYIRAAEAMEEAL